MTGRFEKGAWIEEPTLSIPVCITLESQLPCAKQVERVAKLLNLKPLMKGEMEGEIIIGGAEDHWYRLFDFIEKTLERMR